MPIPCAFRPGYELGNSVSRKPEKGMDELLEEVAQVRIEAVVIVWVSWGLVFAGAEKEGVRGSLASGRTKKNWTRRTMGRIMKRAATLRAQSRHRPRAIGSGWQNARSDGSDPLPRLSATTVFTDGGARAECHLSRRFLGGHFGG